MNDTYMIILQKSSSRYNKEADRSEINMASQRNTQLQSAEDLETARSVIEEHYRRISEEHPKEVSKLENPTENVFSFSVNIDNEKERIYESYRFTIFQQTERNEEIDRI